MLLTLFTLVLTLLSYRLAWWAYEKSQRHPLLHPFLIAMLPVSAVLLTLDISYADYLHGTAVLQFFLGPATVALAWPLYRQLATLSRIWRQVLLFILLGAPLAAGLTVGLAALLGAPLDLIGSLAPKSITTPIALEVSSLIGGYPALTAGVVAVTGIVGVLAAPLVFRLLRVSDDRVRGLALGLVAHAIGTAKAFEYGERAGAYSSLALGLTGLLTALALPWLWPYIAAFLS